MSLVFVTNQVPMKSENKFWLFYQLFKWGPLLFLNDPFYRLYGPYWHIDWTQHMAAPATENGLSFFSIFFFLQKHHFNV